MTLITDIMAVNAPGPAGFLFMANNALHEFIFFKIFQGSLTDYAFFFHILIPH
jgi:hypothetical protein